MLLSISTIPHSRYIYAAVLFISLCAPFIYHTRLSYITKPTTLVASIMSDPPHTGVPSRKPVYFLSIGGPNFMENVDHPAYAKLAEVGQEITTKVKPKAVVVFSAHWQGDRDRVLVNVAEQTDLIYDFYGFPPHYYEYEYPNKGSPEIAEKVIEKLSAANIEVGRVERGLDHGVWVGFIAAFNPKTNPLNVPIVQVSLYGNEDPDKHYRLGKALEGLRDDGILIIGAGMAVHNLQDFRAIRGSGKTMPYASSFDESLKEAVTAAPEERQARMSVLLKSIEARKAHPTFEHILPMYVVAGAAGSDLGERLWTFAEGSLNWAQYRFGGVTEW
ncbi:putative aromatic ring-opening dioxygenase LigB subunit [Hypoxylon trugodes]|uniref:putative aromatic ring-opening dioxygenase LigB subunit n=1 Tax=Hypoxylon trugodes TaxID=326681 RepID=UPI002195760B|nr:putative aromatic ring-opening dioxygenase LigB subunit [Hypoxylon trugodes]KAI1387682.1 putative aromatic ring-opening dioxygenase LigB subunit [Hypoxylon trugodes]